jgi:hypothetical protein
MGAGKSSIARLVYYCLGGDLDFSPAMQSEFVSASLSISVNEIPVTIERARESDQVLASWEVNKEKFNLILPARVADGVVLPETEVEVLSDLFFYLAGITPPRVRKSKVKDDSALTRLSIIDILWYCYLDQDSFDSDFFNLGEDANPFKRLKSRDVLRFILGFHQEKVAELESELQALHMRKLQLNEAAKLLKSALIEADVASEEEIIIKIDSLKKDSEVLNTQIQSIKRNRFQIPHGIEVLRERGRILSDEIDALKNAIPDVEKSIDQHRRHKNEILTLGIKVQRVAAARAVLAGVNFESCPRCAQQLPHREEDHCIVCGQIEPLVGTANVDASVLEQDAKSRLLELDEAINLHQEQLRRMRRRLDDFVSEKNKVDNELTSQMRDYDSAYLSNALAYERQQAEMGQQITNLEKLIKLPQKAREIQRLADEIQTVESQVRKELEEARKGAEADMSNLSRLKALFLDCILRSKLSGFTATNQVEISHKDFLPEVMQPDTGDLTVTSFANLSSGGKKTLFKACYALAIHRLATEVSALLPTFLIIDSPMKNISERENRIQFEGFHQLIYELAADELSETQIILIDKEYCAPVENIDVKVSVRHMTPDNSEFPPLIPYYRGL